MLKLYYSTFFILLLNTIYAQETTSSAININNHLEAMDLVYSGRVALIEEKQKEAIRYLNESIELDSTIREAYIFLNNAYYETEDTDSQIKNLKTAKTIFKKDDEFCYYLGKTYQKKKQYNKAISEFSEAIKYSKINGEDYEIVFDYYSSRGACYLKTKMYTKSLKDFDYALKLNSTESSIYANRGFSLYKLKRKKQACESWKRALKLGNNNMKKYISKYCK